MDNTIIVALLSLVGTLIGTFGGIVASSKLTTYRISQLEKKVEKHNSVIERVFKIESHEETIDREIEDISHKIESLEKYHK